MNYFNYFSQCDKKNKKSKSAGMKSMVAMLILLIIIAGGVYGYFTVQAGRYQAQLDYLQGLKMNTGFMEQHSVALRTAELLAEAKADYEAIGRLNYAAGVLNTANKDLADTINHCMVEGSYISRFSVADNRVTLDGYAESISMVTVIEQNLRKSSAFQKIQISVIEDKEGTEPDMPKFTCLLVLKGGAPIQ